jgi:hypothetical protein
MRIGLTPRCAASAGSPIRVRSLIAAAVASFGASALAAGIDSRVYTCSQLHALIAERGFIYIGIPFQGFAVAGTNFCSGSSRLESRSVMTSDDPKCNIPYCETLTKPG